MKKIIRNLLVFSILSVAANQSADAQTQNVGVGTLTPDASARLDIVGTNRGLLIPRVSLLNNKDKTTVPAPATGLLVYNTNASLPGGTGFYYNAGTTLAASWSKLQDGTGGTGWSLTGNADTDSTANFLGTTDANPIMFRVNNKHAGFIASNGGIAVGRGANGLNKLTPTGIIAIGDSALYNNLDSSEIAIGDNALYSNTTGFSNTALGNFSLVSNNTGSGNVGLGDFTLSSNGDSSFNTAVGYGALNTNIDEKNTAVGALSLTTNGFGFYNSALGFASLYSNDNGVGNTSIGTYSTVSNVSGSVNTAVGLYALYGIEGDENTSVGYNSMGNNTGTGYSNSAFGADALSNLTSGNFNTAIGDSSAYTLASGNYNTTVGYLANVASGTLINSTAIGYNAIAAASNRVRVGNTAITSIGGQVAWSTLSDGRYKKDVLENVKGLDFIMQLRPVTYHYNFDKLNADNAARLGTNVNGSNISARMASFNNSSIKLNGKLKGMKEFSLTRSNRPLGNNLSARTGLSVSPEMAKYYEEVNQNNQIRYTGFIAQEVEATAKKIGYDFSGVDKPKNENDQYALRYSDFVVPLVKAVQEQQAIIDAQNKKIDELTARLEKLELQK